MVSIRGFGSYIPLYRIERTEIADQHGDYAGGGETAVPAHDETVVTLGVSATETALAHADIDGDALDAVFAASTSDPFDERGIAAHVAYAAGATPDVRVADFEGSARAGTDAVLAARDAVESGHVDTVAVVATDILTADPGTSAEQTAGAGAAALVLDRDGDIATVDAAAANTTGFVGRFKRTDATPVGGDGRFNRARYIEAVTGAIDRLEDGFAPTHAVLPAPDGGWGDRVLGAAELDAERHSSFDAIGYAGAASVLIDAALALERARPDEELLLTGYGPGGADAMALTAGDGVERTPDVSTQEYVESKEYVTYAKHRDYRERARGGV